MSIRHNHFFPFLVLSLLGTCNLLLTMNLKVTTLFQSIGNRLHSFYFTLTIWYSRGCIITNARIVNVIIFLPLSRSLINCFSFMRYGGECYSSTAYCKPPSFYADWNMYIYDVTILVVSVRLKCISINSSFTLVLVFFLIVPCNYILVVGTRSFLQCNELLSGTAAINNHSISTYH